MDYKVCNIEDCVEILAGTKLIKAQFDIEPHDINFLKSIARQVCRGIALTDRQHKIVKEKIIHYEIQFNNNGIYGIKTCLDNLRMPLRDIDRSRWIRLESLHNQKKIAVRFVFNKKLIKRIDYLKKEIKSHRYDSIKKIHYFDFNETNLFKVIREFKDCSFEIEQDILNYYEKLINIDNHKEKYLPGVFDFELKNLKKNAIDYIKYTLGDPSNSTLHLYRDRSNLFGLHYFDEIDLQNSLKNLSELTQKIVMRSTPHVLIDKTNHKIDKVVESILDLQRFPLLVILPDKDPLDNLSTVHNHFKNVFSKNESAVLFRLDNTETRSNFNQYIEDNNLNNSLAENTKIVYINSNKLPKPILKSNWKPVSALLIGSRRLNTKISGYIEPLDLVLHHDTEPSPFYRADKIEKI